MTPSEAPDLSNMQDSLAKRERACRILNSWEMLHWFSVQNGEVCPPFPSLPLPLYPLFHPTSPQRPTR